MYSIPSSIARPRRFGSGLSPAAARRKHRQRPRAERLQILNHARKDTHTVRLGWDPDEREDGRRLAFDPTVALPGERQRHMPRLKRQEAFCIPKTWDISDTDIVVSDAELYRLGILYDDDGSEHIHGSGFCLDAITHQEPVYSIRPTKRTKKSHYRRLPLGEKNSHLSVELLSTYLSDNTAITRFFAPMGDKEPARLHHDDFGGTNQQQMSSTLRNVSAEPLSIIYGLSESSIHSTPTEIDSIDLMSDQDEERCKELKEDISYSGDWALVSDTDSDAGQSIRDTDWVDTEADMFTGHEAAADPVGGAWVFLAGDDS
ncbi:hypothetical protein FHL15_010384 [Xylaria flabelliformis]|uniref:Uncharacterized protein n=1 Tax=Xylaria flabelliformis TaxID=2512241 RepID=A0A553HL83_9PEZI|nr:hypothetical protein FHL15_010384 [Xylaria flabelliformis]